MINFRHQVHYTKSSWFLTRKNCFYLIYPLWRNLKEWNSAENSDANKMAFIHDFCNPKMLSQGDENINPYNSSDQNFLMLLHFPIEKLDFKRQITTFLCLDLFT